MRMKEYANYWRLHELASTAAWHFNPALRALRGFNEFKALITRKSSERPMPEMIRAARSIQRR